MIKSISVLILIILLFLSIILLQTFSYNSFFPLSFDFGFYLYCSISVFFLLVGEITFNEKYSFLFPLYIVILNTVTYFIVLVNFKLPISSGHGAGDLIYVMFIIGVNIGLLFYSILSVPLGINALIIKKWELFSKAIEKHFVKIILTLMFFIFTINAFIFYDYSTVGREIRFSYKTDFTRVVKTAINNNDASYCDILPKEHTSSKLFECYEVFFESTPEIKKLYAIKRSLPLVLKRFYSQLTLKGEIPKVTKEPFKYFKIYNNLMKQNCEKSTNKKVCKNALLSTTYPILEFYINFNLNNIVFRTSVKPLYPSPLVITIEDKSKNQEKIKDALGRIVSILPNIKKYSEFSMRKDNLVFVIDSHKLVEHQDDLDKIYKIFYK